MKLTTGRITALAAVLLIAAGYALAWHPSIPPTTTPQTFAPTQIARGAELAAVGDCAVCHTAQNGRPYAGGRGVPTPFGTIYATNITPDPQTGIGQWSESAFRRAMRDGIDREGNHLYPVLPYPHFTRASDEDISAMYAFLMSRSPIQATTPPNNLPFPLDYRILLTGWNLLYLKPGPWQPDPAHDPAWNRGAYLVEAIGHCGACHTRTTRSAPSKAARRWPAVTPKTGMPRPSSPPPQHASPGPRLPSPATSAPVSTPTTAPLPAQ